MNSNIIVCIIEAKYGNNVVIKGEWDNFTNDLYPKIDDSEFSCEPKERKLIYELILKKGAYDYQFHDKKKDKTFIDTDMPKNNNYNKIYAYISSKPILYKKKATTDFCDIKDISLILLDNNNKILDYDTNKIKYISKIFLKFNIDAESLNYCIKDKRFEINLDMSIANFWLTENSNTLAFLQDLYITKVESADCFVLTYMDKGNEKYPDIDHCINKDTYDKFKKIHDKLTEIKTYKKPIFPMTYRSGSPDEYNSFCW
jgi:hypothetical protein